MPVGGGFNSFCPEDVKAERAFMDAVEKTLPPRDLFRVPIMVGSGCAVPWCDLVGVVLTD